MTERVLEWLGKAGALYRNLAKFPYSEELNRDQGYAKAVVISSVSQYSVSR